MSLTDTPWSIVAVIFLAAALCLGTAVYVHTYAPSETITTTLQKVTYRDRFLPAPEPEPVMCPSADDVLEEYVADCTVLAGDGGGFAVYCDNGEVYRRWE